MVRLAAYTGLRRGELVTLKWHDLRWGERVLVVERALSGGVEGTTKSRRARYVPLADQALGALDRLSRRPNFVSVEITSSLVRQAIALTTRPFGAGTSSRDAAGLPPLRFHDLRHTAGTLLTRVLDPGDRPRRARTSRRPSATCTRSAPPGSPTPRRAPSRPNSRWILRSRRERRFARRSISSGRTRRDSFSTSPDSPSQRPPGWGQFALLPP